MKFELVIIMNQTKYNLDDDRNGSKFLKERTSNFIKGLGAYFAGVLTNISFMILLALSLDWKAYEATGLLSYLTISLLYLVLYSTVTTRTETSSISYRLMQILKRFFDVILAALSIFLLMPLLILLSVAIRIDSPGPILFRSKRIGQFGKSFDIYKFRTMHLAPSEQPVTRVGKFLRRFSLNELPLLINVLNGELSLVGPRPRSPQSLDTTLDHEGKILSVRPGITGLWQVSISSSNEKFSFKDAIRLDLQYIHNWSLALDIRILFKTLLVVFQNG
jgi:lipopolysaccharide/colanic/teichoic acid biosynthesis glycosyltransferase